MELFSKSKLKEYAHDLAVAFLAGMVVATAYYFFQNSNGFAPGGVGGLATITFHLLEGKVEWAYLMIAFNLPIFILVTAMVNKKLGIFLSIYMLVQSFGTKLYEALGAKPYCFAENGDDFEIMFACIATGVISGIGFSLMLRHFGASGGTYAISALIKKARPAANVAYVAFILDASVVFVAFFVYGMRVTPVICTLVNLFVANIVVDNSLSGLQCGYKFEIVTKEPQAIANAVMEDLHHGVTAISVKGMYSNTDSYMLVCIVRKKQIGEMMKIIKAHPGTFANMSKVSEVFGRFRK